MQEAAQFISVVEPEDYSLADRAPFPSQIPAPVPLNSVLFRERHHDLIDAVHQRLEIKSGANLMREKIKPASTEVEAGSHNLKTLKRERSD